MCRVLVNKITGFVDFFVVKHSSSKSREICCCIASKIFNESISTGYLNNVL